MPRPKFWFYPWRGGGAQALALAEALDGRVIKRINSAYSYKPGDIIVNWGNHVAPQNLIGVPVLNRFDRVGHGKRENWKTLAEAGIKVPTWTTDRETAKGWNCRIVARDTDHGMGGQGVTVYQSGSEVGQHRYYTKYVKKEREFRFHVFQGRIIFVQEKLRKKDAENVDRYVRSHARGWCFAFKHLVEFPPAAGGGEVAIASVSVLGLDFGAVDCGWSARSGFTVFEVNSAPGIENTSLQSYVDTLKGLNHVYS